MQDTDERAGEELAMANFLGLFLVLAVGCALGVVVSCVDLAVSAARRARLDAEPFSRRFLAELRFVFRFEQSVKPLQVSIAVATSERAMRPARYLSSPSVARTQVPLSESSSGSERDNGAGDGGGAAEGGVGEAEETSGSVREGRAESRRDSRRRRSSMHAASLRLARHTARDSDTPSHHRAAPLTADR